MTKAMMIQALVLLALVSGARADGCEPNPCGNGKICYHEAGEEAAICMDVGYRPGGCSLGVQHCHDQARCSESEDGKSYTCNCVGEAAGDGFTDGEGCQLPFKPCETVRDCPQFGFCNTELSRCQCKPGFSGSGKECEDINECDEVPRKCDPNADCTNFPGGFDCTCNATRKYVGNGFTCRLFCHSHDDCDWPRARCNENNDCQCNPGYSGDGMVCIDIDECATGQDTNCHEKAECVNTMGGYECKCKNGYGGDGKTCEPLPKSCEEIPKRKTKTKYLIDPDFEGPANAFTVVCQWVAYRHWATTVPPKDNFPKAAPEIDSPLEIEYEPTAEDIKALVDNSNFCSQRFSFSCTPGFALFPGTTWYDATGEEHNSWGSSFDEMCTCGELNRCPNNCYCDGRQTDPSTTDEVRIVDKEKLPLMSISFTQEQQDKGRVDVEPLLCSSKPIDIPKDCHEAKFKYKVDENQPMYIDLDGEGEQPAFLVFCDVESFEHVGITQIPTMEGNPVEVTSPDGEPVEYPVDQQNIRALLEASLFCSQRVEFRCTNSRIGKNGAEVFVTGDVRKLDFFPGANGKEDSCGCGATESCDSPEVMCNCNIDDGEARKDFGLIIDKSDLPVTKVTAQVGDARSSTYVIGDLKCSQKQFGVEPNCEKYHAIGVTESYTYYIDSDGTGGNEPFPVQCKFVENPPQGKTIVHHNNEGSQIVGTDISFVYLMANPAQIEGLLQRSTFCTQEISVDCKEFTVEVKPGDIVWTGLGDGPEGTTKKLSDYLDSCGPDGEDCQCSNVEGSGKDKGMITDMGVLPIKNIDFSGLASNGGSVKVDVGPLVCSEVFPTCKQLFEFVDSGKAVEGEATVVNGFFTTDPDGAGGVEPFEVECAFPETIVQVGNGKGNVGPGTPLEPISKCFDISYTSSSGSPVSPAQVAALVSASSKCTQSLSLSCQSAPASQMVNYTTCDGKTQTGWAGSYGADSCACGVNGVCIGGKKEKCNCDKADGKKREDSGEITLADRLPVCQVCLSIAPPADGSGWPKPAPSLSFSVGNLVCDKPPKTFGSCQESRRGMRVKGKFQEFPRPLTGDPPIPVGCLLQREPPLGILMVKPFQAKITPKDKEPTDITIRYITINITIIGQVISQQKFCSQKIFIYNCGGGETQAGQLGGAFGWYGRDGSIHHDWQQLEPGSKDITDNCEAYDEFCNSCGEPQGYLVTEQDMLPISRLVLNGKNIAVVIQHVECFDLLSSCQEIYDTKSRSTGYFGRNRYNIDVDKAGPLRPFRVLCEFDKYNDNAVTVVEVKGEWDKAYGVQGGEDKTKDLDEEVTYDYASPDQINGLAKISDFCWQAVIYRCKAFPLLQDPAAPTNYYKLYDGEPSTSFGTGADVDFEGCACHKLGVCKTAYTCNCDDEGAYAVDQGFISDRDSLPVTGVYVAARNDSTHTASFRVTDVRCSAKSTALPRDCAEAFQLQNKDGINYKKSGEYMISPNPGVVEPYMVRCDFKTFPGLGVTVIRPDFPENNPIPENDTDTPVKVPYYGVTKEQVEALIGQSKYCYQGVRFDCYHAKLLSGGSSFSNYQMGQQWTYWGGGRPAKDGAPYGTCACGKDKVCAGLDSAAGQRSRPCNCDLMDDVWRRDAGVIADKDALPVAMFQMGEFTDESEASLTVGDLYCSQEKININECELGFHDCDDIANCVDMEDGYHCVCPEGFQGLGVVLDSEHAMANGRECIDDDECVAFKMCDYYADCHNLIGSFNCTCKPGFKAKKNSKTDCEDVDECAEGMDDCGENANCENMIGSYRCICKKGYRGDGKECIPVGQCSCFGDPHCNSFDNRWLHYQGDCSYVMATDGCNGEDPNFQVNVEFWRRGQDPAEFHYSWVKTVIVQVHERTIRLEQGPRVVVDGEVVQQYIDSYKLRVVQVNQRVQLKTFEGLEITWDGEDRVSVTVPRSAHGKTCGLCGNYNGKPEDDWTIGPSCPDEEGQETDNYVLFGRSWSLADQCSVECKDVEPPPPPEECASAPKATVEAKCAKLLQVSAFKNCLDQKSKEDLEEWEFSCVFDLCASTEDMDDKVCRLATNIAKDCAEADRIPTRAEWRKQVEECEAITCENNQVYQACGPASPPSCFSEAEESGADTEPCMEGCFCPDGWLLEADACIKPEQCGCFRDNTYIATGTHVILSDCSAEILCEGLNNTQSKPVMCGMNAECRHQDGVTSCYCIEGHTDVNGTCEEDACRGVVCGDYMKCSEGICECIDGYQGECGQCVDIDECETDKNSCNGVGQKCVNVPGSFNCMCEAGFVEEAGKCRDVNECMINDHNCGDHSECVNTVGGYVCECCAGYKHWQNGHCVRDADKETAGDECCACKGERCVKPGKVCGTDGQTYGSYRALSIAMCKEGEGSTLALNYEGPCQSSCDGVICGNPYEVCKTNGQGVHICKCPDCSMATKDDVCGSDGVTYSSICALKQAACESKWHDMILIKHQGPCTGDGTSKPSDHDHATSHYSSSSSSSASSHMYSHSSSGKKK